MKKILIPVDFSKYSIEALKIAAQIARKYNSEIIILNILDLPHHTSTDVFGNATSIPEIMIYKNLVLNKLDELMSADYLKGLTVSKAVEFTKITDGIIDASEKNNADLIVMGSHGSSGIEELLIGSNTEKIVRFSKIPVLVIKRGTKEFKSDNFVFASDFSEETKKPFKKMLDIAKTFNSKLTLVMICSPSSFVTTDSGEKIMKNYVSNFDISNYSTHIYNDTDVESGILNFANKVNADLIGMCSHSKTTLSRLYNGSISEDLANHSAKPVITFKIQ